MPVIHCRANLFQDDKELHRLLLSCQEKSLRIGCSQIVSISQTIDLIDPLYVLQKFLHQNTIHFYWENCQKEESIVALGTTKFSSINPDNRFIKSQQFIQDCLAQVIRTGDIYAPFSGPHFFCAFTFFPQGLSSPHGFAPGTLFLPEIQISRYQNQSVFVANLEITPYSNLELILETFQKKLKDINWSTQSRIIDPYINAQHTTPKAQVNCSKSFTSAVSSALKSIDKKQFSKIVLAHTLDVISPNSFAIEKSLYNLRKRHQDCYIFSTSNGKGNTFIGASPERLISLQNQQLATDALAGSAPRGKTPLEDAKLANKLLKSSKERREHEAVRQFINQRLKELGLRPIQSPRQLLQLSNIQHLWTPIQASVPSHIHPLDIIAQLHPTPAVSGVPRKVACEQIRRYESFDRGLYAAPLGWIDYQGNSEFIVGIRSALIVDNYAQLYAGAGIVAGSDPNKELAEVQLKLQTMLKALG